MMPYFAAAPLVFAIADAADAMPAIADCLFSCYASR